MPRQDSFLCGARFWRPSYLQRFATAKTFLVVYGFLGFTQAMGYMYFMVTLTTLEKRFKIPSYTTGIVLSGNEISQILLSLFLSYYGGQRNRPRWIAWGVVICGISCFILAMPHFIYGAGDEALRLTKEFIQNEQELAILHNTTSTVTTTSYHSLCLTTKSAGEDCDQLFSVVPLVLIFLSQFILGIGNTLYYSLGQSYLDDNTKKTNTPMLLGLAFSLRMVGPILGILLSYVFLNMYIDPTKTPVITNMDPRWLGAWWLGWIVLGISMIFFAGLIGLFPRDLPRQSKKKKAVIVENGVQNELIEKSASEKYDEVDGLMAIRLNEKQERQLEEPLRGNKPKLKDFPTALKRLLTNKLLMFNICSAIFYILGSGGFMTFMSKYMEVQFNKSKGDATIIAGPLTIFGMVFGLLASGWVLSKKKPSTSKVLLWNVMIGCFYIAGQFSYNFLSCSDDNMPVPINGKFNLTRDCNSNCNCDGLPYNPVCDVTTGQTFFSACHAGCSSWDTTGKVYSNCSCSDSNSMGQRNILSSNLFPITEETTLGYDYEDDFTTTMYSVEGETGSPFEDVSLRKRRSGETFAGKVNSMIVQPGACLAGCQESFLIFIIISGIINCMGASGKIGNILVNYRVVAVEDKSFSQGLMLMMLSLFALIPGPIIFGWIIDSTCLVWNYKCGKLGNCQMYDRARFRISMNSVGLVLTAVGVIFDGLVWYYGRTLDLYSEEYEENNKKFNKSEKIIRRNDR